MINIKKAEDQILKDLPCKILDKHSITNQGTYLLFENVEFNNHLNIDYHFSVFVALSFYQKNMSLFYKELNDTLNAINSSLNIDLLSCKPLQSDGNLRIYRLAIKTKIIGEGR